MINPPLLIGDDRKKTLELMNISELHILTGSVSKIVSEMERLTFSSKKEGKKFLDNFFKAQDIRKCVYQGSNSFEGNQARKVLQKVDMLEQDVKKLDFETATKAIPFVDCLRKLDKVVTSCFGQTLDPAYEDHITAFSQQYRSLDISVTPKVTKNIV